MDGVVLLAGDALRCISCSGVPGGRTSLTSHDDERGRLSVRGREVCLAFRYSPHALQMTAPSGERLQSGVRVVLQLL